MKGSIAKAQELIGSTPGSWMPQQFDNPANIEVHVRTTAREILADFPDGLDALITGVGTGGHITGCARVLKAAWPGLKVFAVEPTQSPVISGGAPSPHPIQGIGAGFIPKNLDTSLLDGVITVEAEAAREMARRAAREEGVLVGISSGARSRPSRRSCLTCPREAACSASTTTRASATCRSRDSCRPEPRRWPATVKQRLAMRKLSALVLAFAIALLAMPAGAADVVDAAETQRLHALFDQRWEELMRRYPEWATYVGDHRYGDRLRDASPEAIAADYAAARRALKRRKGSTASRSRQRIGSRSTSSSTSWRTTCGSRRSSAIAA